MLKQTAAFFKSLFANPKIEDIHPDFSMADNLMYNPTAGEENAHRLAVAEFKLQKDALQKQLTLQHRTMIIALISVVISSAVATAAIVVAVTSHQNVEIKVVQLKQ